MATKVFAHEQPLDRFTSLGGYPLVYLVKVEAKRNWPSQEVVMCARCAFQAKYHGVCRDGRVEEVTPFVHYEGGAYLCEANDYDMVEGCDELIESAYGDPEEEVSDDV